jgi:PAT family beta-lactamase induction signal transducer AmpG
MDRSDLSIYFDKRMLKILLLGIIQGFPWVIILSVLNIWLKEYGVSKTTIGFSGLIFFVYSINWIWAPLIDRINIPLLSNNIGQRKSWIMLMQFIIFISLILWTNFNPSDHLFHIILIALIIACSSATQDIQLDALRIEQVKEKESSALTAGAAVMVMGWYTGFKIFGGATLIISKWFEENGYQDGFPPTFIIMSFFIIICNFLILYIPEMKLEDRNNLRFKAGQELLPNLYDRSDTFLKKILQFITDTIITPFWDYFKKNGLYIGFTVLGFLLLFKVGEAFLGRMSSIFYLEVGFSKSDIAIFSKGLGWIIDILFTFIGSLIAIKSGIIRALIISGIAMASTNLLFAYLAWIGPSYPLFVSAVILDEIAGSFATVFTVIFISMLVNRAYTATQYALLASIATLGRTVLSSFSGLMIDELQNDWTVFFIITTLMVLPSLVLIWIIRNKVFRNSN